MTSRLHLHENLSAKEFLQYVIKLAPFLKIYFCIFGSKSFGFYLLRSTLIRPYTHFLKITYRCQPRPCQIGEVKHKSSLL